MRPRRGSAALAALAVGAGLVLSGCSSSPSQFASRSDAACAKAGAAIDRLAISGDTSTGTDAAALRAALDRYAIIERLVSQISTSSMPSGDPGKAVESQWLDPSRRSMVDRQPDLRALSVAVHNGDAAKVPSLAAAAELAGTDGVDTAYLRGQGMDSCATVFSP